jgi:hypothetical protein
MMTTMTMMMFHQPPLQADWHGVRWTKTTKYLQKLLQQQLSPKNPMTSPLDG